MIRGIHHVAVHVHDLDRMMAFYRDAFGFELVGEPFSWSDDTFIDTIVDVPGSAARGAMLQAGTCYLEMFQYSAPRPESDKPLQAYDKSGIKTKNIQFPQFRGACMHTTIINGIR